MGKILILRVEAKYNVLNIFLNYLIEAFENLGYQVMTVDLTKGFIELRKIFMHTYKFVFSINGAGTDFSIEGWNIYNRLKLPFITFLVDYPLYPSFRISRPIDRFACTCVDKEHVKFIEKYISNVKNVTFIPHAGCSPQHMLPYEKRDYGIVLIGSYLDPNEIYSELCAKTGTVGIELTKFWIKNIDLTFEEAFRRLLEKYGESISDAEFLHTLYDLRIVDNYIRAYYRNAIVDEIINNNIKLHVIGEGWEKYNRTSDLLIKHGEVDFLEALEIMGQSKIILNITISFRNGAHERIFSSMLAGAVCLTDRTIYLEEEFEEGKNIIFYDLNKLEEIPTKINNILMNSHIAENIAIKAREKATNRHQWKNRAEEIIKISENL